MKLSFETHIASEIFAERFSISFLPKCVRFIHETVVNYKVSTGKICSWLHGLCWQQDVQHTNQTFPLKCIIIIESAQGSGWAGKTEGKCRKFEDGNSLGAMILSELLLSGATSLTSDRVRAARCVILHNAHSVHAKCAIFASNIF